MSKSINRNGHVLYAMRLGTDATISPSKKLKDEWAMLDKYAYKSFNKPYDSLKHKQKVELHFNITQGVFKEIK